MFFKRKQPLYHDFSFLGVDIHNHILPGIDDGAPDTQTSIQLLTELKNLGFSRIIPTPHTYTSLYPNTPNTIADAFDILQIAISLAVNNDALPIVNSFASEYMIDDHFSGIITTNAPLSFGQNRVLIEMSFADSAPMLMDEIFQLQLKGFTPILAHPERYPYLFGQLGYFEHLVSIGCELQLNLLSLTDHYGKGPQKTAIMLLDKQLYSWAGTDTHHMGHITLLNELIGTKLFRKIQDYPFKNSGLISI
jgi:tyrosine-protein phosphatase YwqE